MNINNRLIVGRDKTPDWYNSNHINPSKSQMSSGSNYTNKNPVTKYLSVKKE